MPTELKIIMDDSGNIGVSAPFDQTGLCYMMLEIARDTVFKHAMKQQERLIQPASLSMVPRV